MAFPDNWRKIVYKNFIKTFRTVSSIDNQSLRVVRDALGDNFVSHAIAIP